MTTKENLPLLVSAQSASFGGHCFVAQTYACYLSWPHVQALIISDSKYITLPSARITVLCKPIALVTYNIAGWHPKEKNNKSAGHEGQHMLSSLVHRANWSAWKLGTWSMFLKQHFWNFLCLWPVRNKQRGKIKVGAHSMQSSIQKQLDRAQWIGTERGEDLETYWALRLVASYPLLRY